MYLTQSLHRSVQRDLEAPYSVLCSHPCPRSLEIVPESPLSAAGKILEREPRAKFARES